MNKTDRAGMQLTGTSRPFCLFDVLLEYVPAIFPAVGEHKVKLLEDGMQWQVHHAKKFLEERADLL
jgi:hypothetical protein